MDAALTSGGSPSWWSVVFLPRGVESWWDVLSPERFRHVLCYGYSVGLDAWVVVDPRSWRTVVAMFSDLEFFALRDEWVASGAVIVQIRAGEVPPSSGRILQTCASIVARVVGAPSAWRPQGLMRKLLAAGGEVRRNNEFQGESPSRGSGDQSAPACG